MENKKTILGLDLGTNSIGWALIETNTDKKLGRIIKAGSRILPMSQDILGKFDSGQSISQTAERTGFRGIRRLRERHLLRRERLNRVLNILGFLPEHYAKLIDFEKSLGQFIQETEPKIAYRLNGESNKAEFIFKESFEEMLADFAEHQPQLVEGGRKIPYDWTIYYLRKKALLHKIQKEELAWLLLNFNQKRGYYQLRGEDEEENLNKRIEFYSLRVTNVVATNEKKNNDEIWYNVHLENGWIYRRTSKTHLDWIGKTKEFIVTTELNDDKTIKTDKEGKEKRFFRAPGEDDWTLLKKKVEYDIDRSNKTVGAYIYDTLLQKPNQKIKGKLVRVIERKFYKAELEAILSRQVEFHPELKDAALYQACLEELYEHNDAHRGSIAQKGFIHLFLNDIIFYQRPLKSKKSLISNCKFEARTFIRDGKKEIEPLKCIAKSHPLFQEFRLWQFVQNLRIYQKEKEVNGKLQTDVNVTEEFLKSDTDKVNLFDWLNSRKEIDQKAFLKYPAFNLKKSIEKYRWNYVEDKIYPCNETRSLIVNRLDKLNNVPAAFLSRANEEALWHILYSVEDKNEIQKALKSFAAKKGFGDDFVELFRKFPPFKKEYGSFSAKAIKKMLPLMRLGNYWNEQEIDAKTKARIDKIISGEFDETIRNRVREKAIHLSGITDFKGLPQWLVSYIIYDRHSEDGEAIKWKNANNIELLEQHSLRNPVVEQVINETLQVVRDIWKQHGNGEENFFNEIHVELGREMKNPADKRKQLTNQISENENTNLRIKALLAELLNSGDVENVRPYSPMQQEILKIYEEGVLNAENTIPEDILKITKLAQPTSAELTRYKLWLQQKYRSPYTGQIIPLNKLFTASYEIEHIIPQSRYFDDSFSNKVICETEVNKDKDNSTGYEYIKNNSGKKIELSLGKEVTLFTVDQYEDFVKNNYSKSRSKMKRLLMDEIPEGFIQRQLNDTRYISKVVKNLLSNIVREKGEQETISKNVIVSNGTITSVLKQDWGLNDVWNEIITPRFERLNELTNSKNFGEWANKEGKKVFQTQIPIEFQKGFSKKRLDHQQRKCYWKR
jgi:CRISPR-associated endonuclease Csn1